MGHVGIADKRLVGGVEEYQGSVFTCVVHPDFQLTAREGRACGVVGVAEVDHVDRLRG